MKTTADFPDPVNEPCYSHSSCVGYAVCCVAVGTCDTVYTSSYGKYYQGGCIGVNYKYGMDAVASTSSNTSAFPSTVEGCVKQGECNLPFLEQVYGGTATGGGLSHVLPEPEVIDRLLVGLTETYTGACKDLYTPPNTNAATANAFTVAVAVTAAGEISDFTTDVLDAMKAKTALKMGLHTDNVIVTVASASVIITLTLGYPTQEAADAQSAAMATQMTPDFATALLSTSSMVIAVSAVGAPAVGVAGADEFDTGAGGGTAAAPADGGSNVVLASETAALSNDNSASNELSTGAIAGIACGVTFGVLIIGYIGYMVHVLIKTRAAEAGVPAKSVDVSTTSASSGGAGSSAAHSESKGPDAI